MLINTGEEIAINLKDLVHKLQNENNELKKRIHALEVNDENGKR